MAMSTLSYDPATEIPPLTGKVILVTGGSSGLGRAAVLELCTHKPEKIWLASRDAQAAMAVMAEVRLRETTAGGAPALEFLPLDLASLSSVKQAAGVFREAASRLDLLLVNAGIMGRRAGLTTDGYEIHFGTNYLGHALLTKLLLPVLLRTAASPASDVRIIVVAAAAHGDAPTPEGIRFAYLGTPARNLARSARYGQSQLAKLLWARELAKRFPQLTVVSVHPGPARSTRLGREMPASRLVLACSLLRRRLFGWPVAEAVKNMLWASTAPNERLRSGQYYEPVGVPGRASRLATDIRLSTALWDWTEGELAPYQIR